MQDMGSSCRLFICSESMDEIIQQFYSLYNWNATSIKEMTFLGAFMGRQVYYLHLNKKKLINYFYNIIEHSYYLRTGRECLGGANFRAKLEDLAIKRFKNIERRNLIRGWRMDIVEPAQA